MGIPAEVIDMKDYDPDDQLADEVRQVQREDAFSFLPSVKRQQQVEACGPQSEGSSERDCVLK